LLLASNQRQPRQVERDLLLALTDEPLSDVTLAACDGVHFVSASPAIATTLDAN
jgi:hypothetical protein